MMQLDLFGSKRVLIGCERSGIVRDAFLRRGFDAWSCDVLPDERGSNRHIRNDVRNVLPWGWDLLIIAHPPCTRLCNSGVRWLTAPPPGRSLAEMWRELEEGAELFSDLWNVLNIPHVAIENPIMHRHARERIVNYAPPQIVQPWWFGDPQFKATGLYLRNLPPLVPTRMLTPPARGTDAHRHWSRVHRHSGWGKHGEARGQERSRFFPGIAAAMAQQWGDALVDEMRLAA
ncbi:hypothetical protein LZK98_08330 [Sphingomonas cannabina]|uniref:hypothetical protein n=1 Tax=Sphingomonas cannabina TaxID=2899123 RepID=UPI001F3824B6|nr:hypothetical protein [Sphingomonas cannabina]UIJ46936.1 hypothetical protein LZK98_08330 [Sphingomonas cannabina]